MTAQPGDCQSSATMGSLLLCSALLCLVTRATSQIQYVLTSPAMLISEDNARVCLNLERITEHISISVSLEHNARNITIIEEDSQASKYYQCGEFKVPSVTEAVPVALFFSATGSNTDLRDRKTVVMKSAPVNCMYQFDKLRFKPGQMVRCRLVCLNYQLKPVDQEITSMYVKGPSRAKIVQWLEPKLKYGIVAQEFLLDSDAPSGSYVITTERKSGNPINGWFTVQDYVPPRFSVDVQSPQTVSMTTEFMSFNVSSMYTFGEPMAGSVVIRCCMHPQYYGRRQNCFKDKGDSCFNMTGELGPDGTYSGIIDMQSSKGRSFTLDVTVIEAGTDIQTTESRYVSVTSQPASLSWEYESMRQDYKRGIPYIAVATLKNERGEQMPNEEIDVQINNGETNKAVTDSDGRIKYSVDTFNMVDTNFTIKISYTNPDQCYYSEWSQRDYPTTEYTVQRHYSYSSSFIQIERLKGELSCGRSHSINVGYILSQEETRIEEKVATFYYQILSNSMIVQHGQKDVDISSGRNGTFSMDIMVTYEMAPSADLIVYKMMDNEMITDTMNLNTENCFKNQVSMTFSEERVMPGSTIDALISADPNSYCAMRAIDSSLLLLDSYEPFSAQRISSGRRIYYYGYNVGGYDLEEPAPQCENPDKVVFCNGRYYLPVSSTSEGDTYTNIKNIRLVVATKLRTRKPEVCDNNPPQSRIIPMKGGGFGGGVQNGAVAKVARLEMDSAASPGGAGASPVETFREKFIETGFWVMTMVNTEGQATVSEKVSDSITSFQGTTFCTNQETGFGMTKAPANFTIFLPFFGVCDAPNSVIRGENMEVRGVAYNYLQNYVKATITLAPSDTFDVEETDVKQETCIPPNGQAVSIWKVASKVVGEIALTMTVETTFIGSSCDGPNDPSQPPRKDSSVKTVRVDPEGIYEEYTLSNLVFVQGDSVQIPISITPPDNVVPESSKAYMTVVSDLFGISSQNLNDLVKKPYGCGEQNQGRMASIVAVLGYMNATGQLKKEKLQEGMNFLIAGYQRQLGFLTQGSYRLFPNFGEANSMLTIKTFETFEACKHIIFIDPTVQQQTLIWLQNSQKLENGCFKAMGKSVTNQHSDTNLLFTARMAVALLGSNYSLGHTLLKGCMECLKNASKSEQKMPEEVLMLYAFTLANMEEYRKPLFEKLMKKAKNEGGMLHWEREDMPSMPKVPFFWPVYPSTEVWLTSYMLLCMAKIPNMTPEDLTPIAQTSAWLVRQQNSNGGYRSTEDTPVAIKALAVVAEHFYTPDYQQNVKVTRGNSEVGTFNLDPDNRLVTHKQPLPEANGDYAITVSGKGWCMLQTIVGYNIPVPKENSAYLLSISATSDSCLKGVAYRITLNCQLSYRGSLNESGMAIVQMKMISGFTPNYSSLSKLINDKIIRKHEMSPKGDVVLYLDTVSKETSTFSIDLLMDKRVYNQKTASCYVYSYYENGENGYANYSHPCTGSTTDGGSTEGSSPAKGKKDPTSKSESRVGAWQRKQHGRKQA